MQNTTITLWLNPNDELYFFYLLKIIDNLPIDNKYVWNTNDVLISKNMKSDWLCVNISIDLYLKFSFSLKFNKGSFK